MAKKLYITYCSAVNSQESFLIESIYNGLTLSAPNFRRYLSSAFLFKQTIILKDVYI